MLQKYRFLYCKWFLSSQINNTSIFLLPNFTKYFPHNHRLIHINLHSPTLTSHNPPHSPLFISCRQPYQLSIHLLHAFFSGPLKEYRRNIDRMQCYHRHLEILNFHITLQLNNRNLPLKRQIVRLTLACKSIKSTYERNYSVNDTHKESNYSSRYP